MVISTVTLGFKASKSLTELVNTCSSLLSAAKVCQTSIVIGPSDDVFSLSLSPPKSKQPGLRNVNAKITTRAPRFDNALEGPPSMVDPLNRINKRDLAIYSSFCRKASTAKTLTATCKLYDGTNPSIGSLTT